MSASYFPVISSPFGLELAQPQDYISLDYNRVEGDVGTATLVLPRARYSRSLFDDDNTIRFLCSVDGKPPQLDTETEWLIRR